MNQSTNTMKKLIFSIAIAISSQIQGQSYLNPLEAILVRDALSIFDSVVWPKSYEGHGINHSSNVGKILDVLGKKDMSFFDSLPPDFRASVNGEKFGLEEYKSIILKRSQFDSISYNFEYFDFSDRWSESISFYNKNGLLMRDIYIGRKNNEHLEILCIADNFIHEE